MQLYQQRDHMISSGLLIEIDLPFDNKMVALIFSEKIV